MSSSSTISPLRPLDQRLAAYGCPSVIRLDETLASASAAQIDYLDLLPRQRNQSPTVTAVAEHQGSALLYIVDALGDAKCDPTSLATLRRQLANRSDPAWLGVLHSGTLEIFPIGFHADSDAQPIKIVQEKQEAAPFFFQSLVHGTFEESHKLPGTDYVFQKIFELLTRMTDEFVPEKGKGRLDALEVLSMAGRALFFRFLIDRRIVLENEVKEICHAADELRAAFSSAEKAAQTSAWLDATFNGDFLPLINESIAADDRGAREAEYLRYFKRTEGRAGKEVFTHLEAILRGWSTTGIAVQTEIDWGDLDFAHIPVGVLSQVYQSFSHRAEPLASREASVHYTPRPIAELMVDEAFAATRDKSGATVLDSSCGAGIFLVLAFRRLVRERWENGERPKTSVIQEILYQQVRGFDISESALRLAALALYITAIELNASPRPPRALKFPRNLRGEVLHLFGAKEVEGRKSLPLGSLGPEVPREFNGAFDIVIGNPPWTRLRESREDDDESSEARPTDEMNQEFTAIGRRVLRDRGLGALAERYQNPDKNPDLPFLWRSMEWAKEDGVIALAMHARLFGRASGPGFKAWCAVLRSLKITGLINGADLRCSPVWMGVKAPFCILFARNIFPGPEHRFYYVSPKKEPEINGRGRFRIDYEAANTISAARVEAQPWLLKTLSLGTWLDAELMEQLRRPGLETLKERWCEWDAKAIRTGQGYNRSSPSERGRGSDPKSVEFLAALPVFDPPEEGYQIDYDNLPKYGELYGTDSNGQASAHKPRRKELFQPPLVIVPQAPGDDEFGARAYISTKPVAFSQSYYGYSCASHAEAETLAALIFLLAHSKLLRYFSLMVSASLGADRMRLTKQDFDALPFPDLNTLPPGEKATIRELAHQLQNAAGKPWDEIDDFIFRLYGLHSDDVQVARDTLFAAASYRTAGKAALDRTSRVNRAPFVETLRAELEPYFNVCGERAAVREAEFQVDEWREPWFFLAVSREGHSVPISHDLMRKATEAANQGGCSRIIVHAPGGGGGLLLGLLNQRRWWTVTRARLCGQHIIRERLGACGLPEQA